MSEGGAEPVMRAASLHLNGGIQKIGIFGRPLFLDGGAGCKFIWMPSIQLAYRYPLYYIK